MRRQRLMVAGIGSAAVAAPMLFWLIMLSPYTYQFPDDWQEPAADSTHMVFVYGTLTRALTRWMVMGRTGLPEQYTLEGYERHGLDIVPNPDAEVEGELLSVTAEELRRLDRYERVGVRYERIPIRLADGQQAWAYRRL